MVIPSSQLYRWTCSLGIKFVWYSTWRDFCVDKQFQVRELGCVSDNYEHDRYAFHPITPHSELSDKEQHTVLFVKKNIHGLSFIPKQDEHAQQQHAVPLVAVKALYEHYKTDTETLVAFKGDR